MALLADSVIFYTNQDKFNNWKAKEKTLKSITPTRMLQRGLKINLNENPVVAGKIYFIRIVDNKGDVIVLNERFHIRKEYIGKYVSATIDTKVQSRVIVYNDKEIVVHKIKAI